MSNVTIPAWPYDKPVPPDHTVIPVADGLDIIVTPGADPEDIADARELADKWRARREVQS